MIENEDELMEVRRAATDAILSIARNPDYVKAIFIKTFAESTSIVLTALGRGLDDDVKTIVQEAAQETYIDILREVRSAIIEVRWED